MVVNRSLMMQRYNIALPSLSFFNIFLHKPYTSCFPDYILAFGLVTQYVLDISSYCNVILHIQLKYINRPEQWYSCPLWVHLIDGPFQYKLFLVLQSDDIQLVFNFSFWSLDLPTWTPWIMLQMCLAAYVSMFVWLGWEKKKTCRHVQYKGLLHFWDMVH